ncbi:MAG TPA: FlgD immunoglobulin-like domain containing protein [Candidatus Eisenbacteria bacterium]|nr:FlgD immunoglobulin-like domain containing protein [Candidatus Eisenbacteria bacterium]
MPQPSGPSPRRLARTLALTTAWAALALAVRVAPTSAQVIRDDLWVTNGPVYTELISGSTLYLGGRFERVGPPIGGWAPLDPSGTPIPPAPQLSGTVYCTVPDGEGGWYVGGSFDAVGKQPRTHLARFDQNGHLTSWAPNVNGPVYAMYLFAGVLYVGGSFTSAGGLARTCLAALDTLTGGAHPWNPGADGEVHAICPFGSSMFVGGQFFHLGGLARGRIAAVDTAGVVWPTWDPEANGQVLTIGVRHTLVPNTVTVYAGGDYSAIGGQARNSLAAIDATSGSATFGQATAFNPNANNAVRTMIIVGTLSPTIYVGGDFTAIGGVGRNALAALNGSGAATAWNPGITNGGGRLVSPSVFALALSGTTMYVGGSFDFINGQPRFDAGALDTGTGAVSAWNPDPAGRVNAIGLGMFSEYLGGEFASLGGVVRHNVAALDLVTGEANGWDPNSDGEVDALQVVNGLIYAGGQFANIGGGAHAYVAQLDATTGVAGGWNPNANGGVTSIGGRTAMSRSTIFMGGAFTNVNGVTRHHLAAWLMDPISPGVTSWNPAPDSTVNALTVSGSTVFVGGAFHNVGGAGRNFVAALDLTGAATAWNGAIADGAVTALAATGTRVYAGGAFTQAAGALHRGIVAMDQGTGATQSWPAQVFGQVYAIAPTAAAIYAAGTFTNVGGSTRTNLAALDPTSGAPSAWDPEPWNPIQFPAALLPRFGIALAEQSGRVYAAGDFGTILDTPHARVAGIFESTAAVDPGTPAMTHVPAIEAEPNPFRAGVMLGFAPPRAVEVAVRIYDLSGRIVRTLTGAQAAAGMQHVRWDGRDQSGRLVPPGVYVVRARADGWQASGRLLRIR